MRGWLSSLEEENKMLKVRINQLEKELAKDLKCNQDQILPEYLTYSSKMGNLLS